MRRGVVLAALLVWIARAPARADWQIHRGDSRALVERAERALRERPDDDDLARRLVRLVGPSGRPALLARFRARAEGESSYAAVSAYARLLLAAGDGAAAAAAFDRALEISPGSVASLTGRARALTSLATGGSANAALAAYDEALRFERRPAARRRLLEAELALLAAHESGPPPPEDLERAVRLRRELTTLDPDRDGAASRLADALEQAGHLAEAAAALEARLSAGFALERLPVALRAARLRIASGDSADIAKVVDRAAELARRVPASDAERRREVWAVALAAARRSGTLHELVEKLEGLGSAAGAAEWDTLGMARDDLGDLEGALVALRAAAERAPRDAEIAARLTTLLDRLGRDEEAIRVCEEMTARVPSSPRFAIELADRAMRRGQRDRATAALDRAIVRCARDRSALLELAAVSSRWGLEDRALAVWRRLHRIDPSSDIAIVGLGEAEFQAGRKDEARRSWAALRGRGRPSADGHLRYAEVLIEHDFVADAIAEARKAQTLEPNSAAPHRLLAQIFDRERKLDDAITEWNVVMGLVRASREKGADEAQTSLRREARTRLLALYARQGRGRLENQIRKLASEVAEHPEDPEAVLFLAEAQERAGDANGAADTLRRLLSRAPYRMARRPAEAADGSRPNPDGDGQGRISDELAADATFGLVRLLKRNGQLDEAVARLEEVARTAPSRGREAHLQIAEISLARYDTARALDQAKRVVAGADGPTLARIGDVQLRAGDEQTAMETLRAAVARDGGPNAAMALVRLLERRGAVHEAADILDRLLRTSGDDETVTEAGRLAIDLAEVEGSLPNLERRFAERLAARDTPAGRAAFITLLKRLVPPLYRDAKADETRTRLGRDALRPLLELVTDADQPPDRAAVELIGMLGRSDAAPALARLLQIAPSARPAPLPDPLVVVPRPREGNRRPEPIITPETRLAAVIALGRLADRRGAAPLERLVASADTNLRAAVIWALGRVGDERGVPTLLAAAQDRRPEIAMAACLGLGRQNGAAAFSALVGIVGDSRQPIPVRRSAILALGRLGRRDTAATLFRLMDSGDGDLAKAAAVALAWSRDPAVVPGLLGRALLPRRFGLADSSAPLGGLAVFAAGAEPADEARFLGSVRLDLDGATMAVLETDERRELMPLLRMNAAALRDALADALARGSEARGEALVALDGSGDRLGLGALLTNEAEALTTEGATTIHEVVPPLADRLTSLLDDADPIIRAHALRVLSKLGDERISPARIVAAVSDDSVVLAAAGAYAAGVLARDRPTAIAGTLAALLPGLSAKSWQRRLATVEALAALGPTGTAALDRARNDPNAIVRGAAVDAGGRRAIDLPAPPSTMP